MIFKRFLFINLVEFDYYALSYMQFSIMGDIMKRLIRNKDDDFRSRIWILKKFSAIQSILDSYYFLSSYFTLLLLEL